MYNIIDGNKISKDILEELKIQITELNKKGVNIKLSDIQVGEDPASSVYIKNKAKKFADCGIAFDQIKLKNDITENELLLLIDKLNDDKNTNGIFVELPLPKHIDNTKVINHISPKKDVDGFNIANIGALTEGIKGFYPCTAEGIVELIKRSGIEISGKHCVVVGRSNIVGKPVALLMLKENATITICHSKTSNIKEICRTADILIVATRNKKGIDDTYIKEGAVVIDVGIHREKICDKVEISGDVDFDKVAPHTSYITPVPGGVGPMTVTMLIKHMIDTVINE